MDPRTGEPGSGPEVGGRYALVRRIARGGGGTVWQAHDDMLGRTVAVKEVEIADELSDDERDRLRRRVLAEARAAARLEHPAVVVIHDVLEGDDMVHLVMEYVEAPTLRSLVDERGPLDERVVAAIGYGLLDVLAEAHRRGVVHRDVKPSNVFVLNDGAVKLGDFGIAALTGEVSLTRTGVALGSPSYLAPEQARGESAAPPADLWGLGATLYYAAEGRPPFDRRTALATVHAVVNEPIRPFERADALQPVLTALLTKDPARRPDLDAVRAQLAGIAGLPTPPTRTPPAAGPPTSRATRPATATAAGAAPTDAADERRGGWGRWLAAALLLVVVAIGVNLLGGDDPEGTDTPTAAPETEAEATEEQPAEREVEETADADQAAPAETEAETDERTEADDRDTPEEPEGSDGDDDGGSDADGAYVVPETDAPGDWQVVEGETYRIAVPAGWQRRDLEGSRTDWVDPETGAYLRVDWTDQPADDPFVDWQRYEPVFADRQADYQRIRLDPARYRDWDAAMWEYTYADDGSDLHAINLNVLADDVGHAFALNLQAPAGQWDAVAAGFPAIVGSFEPTVGG